MSEPHTPAGRLLLAIVFQGDPLDIGIPVPGHLRREACSCDPVARHSLRCEATPLFTKLVYEMAERPGYVDPYPTEAELQMMWPMRWICVGDGVHAHTGGAVNGPAHWCTAVGGFVPQLHSEG